MMLSEKLKSAVRTLQPLPDDRRSLYSCLAIEHPFQRKLLAERLLVGLGAAKATIMDDISEAVSGWQPIPLPLKVLSVVMVLWSVGAVLNLPNLLANGLPLFGVFVYGLEALLVVVLLDIIGPLTFLFGLWNRKRWAAKWAYTYIGIFILNSAVALLTVREQLGLPQIFLPAITSIIFVAVIYWKREYFAQNP